jgi:Vacuolar protein sorting-associated protein 26
MKNFFGFGQSVDIEIALDGQESRKTAEIKTEDGRKERHYLYLDGETISGKVSTLLTTSLCSSSEVLLFGVDCSLVVFT